MACHAAHHANEWTYRLCTASGRDKTTKSEIPEGEIGHRCLHALVVGPLRPRVLLCKVDASSNNERFSLIYKVFFADRRASRPAFQNSGRRVSGIPDKTGFFEEVTPPMLN
jgi:hypothetical protein